MAIFRRPMEPLYQTAALGGGGGGAPRGPGGGKGRPYALGAVALALGGLGLLFASRGCEGPQVHELSNDWITQAYSKDPNVLGSGKEWFYVFEECPKEGGPCTRYMFQGSKESVGRAVIKMKKGERYTFTPGNLDSISEARQ